LKLLAQWKATTLDWLGREPERLGSGSAETSLQGADTGGRAID